jgi:O-antigen biosynthesis protein WbqP
VPAAPCEPVPVWKRLEDVVGTILILPVALILAAVVATTILLESGPPVLIQQRRIGREAKEFRMWKFRTLPLDTPQVAKSDLEGIAARATRLGRILRRTSLDELPQLLNVLAGDMSLIGPRPALFNQYELTAMRANRRVHCLLPGMTGLAQVRGRENLALPDKVELDAEYMRTISIWTDLRIAYETVGAVIARRGSR